MSGLKINGQRLWRSLMDSAKIGATPRGGLCRLALSDADRDMRNLFVEWCEIAGLTICIDRVGNIFARRPGLNAGLKPVMMGSHLDTQIRGGRFDGILGVLAGLEIMRTLNDHGVETRHPIEIACWTNEEGVRFQPPMMGAGAFVGAHDTEWVLDQVDCDGKTFGEELVRIGYAGPADCGPANLDSYFELHIEQGPILYDEGTDVGIVTGGFTSHGAQVRFLGETAHSGATPMRKRKDALVAAARLISAVNDVALDHEPHGRATGTRIDVSPNQYGIVADAVEVTVDVRHPDRAVSGRMYEQVLEAIAWSSARAGTTYDIGRQWSFGDVRFDTGLINLVRTVSAELEVSHRHVVSAAGHDAYQISKVAPTVMIFTPCRDGITHNEAESIDLEHTVPGVEVLLNSILRRANQHAASSSLPQ